MALTGQERMRRAIERRDHDRVPRFDQFWPETLKRWRDEGLEGDPAERFGFDVCMCSYFGPVPFPGPHQVLAEDEQTRIVRNGYGQHLRCWKNQTGTPEHVGAECTDPDVWRSRFKPRYAVANTPPPIERQLEAYRAGRERQQFCCIAGRGVFCSTQSLLGDEGLFLALASDPQWIRDMASTYTDVLLDCYQATLDAGVHADAVWYFDDLAYTAAPFMSVAMYRDLIWPEHQRTARWCHDHGLKFILHTDGDVRSFMDSFVEAGVDCLQPMEAKARMDVRLLAPRYGDRLSFFGNLDMIVAGRGDRAEIEHEVKSKLAAGMARRGYACHSDHSVHPGVSWDTYQWIMELVDRHGCYA